jgi:hypothetical protein
VRYAQGTSILRGMHLDGVERDESALAEVRENLA